MASSRAVIATNSNCSRWVSRQIGTQRAFSKSVNWLSEHESRLPRVVSPSFWSTLIPKAWRKSSDPDGVSKREAARAVGAEERRTGIIFLVLGLVVGSNAIHLLNIKREMLNYSRLTDAKLAALREVIERVRNGEDVDVKRLLGTGDAQQEAEWEEVLKELENTDMLWEGKKEKEAKRAEKAARRKSATENDQVASANKTPQISDAKSSPTPQSSGPRFLM